MFIMRRIHDQYGDNICRRCINKRFHVDLQQEDCLYGYMYKCPGCKQGRQIVVGLTLSGKLKTLLK